MNQNNYVAIMAGGIGSRFWPMSRTKYPKQFLDIMGTGKTLLQSTYNRFLPFIPPENIYIVTADEYVDIIKKQLPQLPLENILGEPERKNTAPCIAYVSLKLKKKNPLANLIVAPSDHLIENQDAFEKNCLEALRFTAKNNAIVTMGIQPSHANTGYGYIQYRKGSTSKEISHILRFTEKPDKATALKFLEDGSYLWNSGIFIWKAEDIVNAFKQYAPALYDQFNIYGPFELNSAMEKEVIKHIYKSCDSISIDYAILEKAKNVYVLPAKFDWNDLGTWNSVWEIKDKDSLENAVFGKDIFLVDSSNCIVHSTDKKLMLVGGVNNLIIVNTPDALLICDKDKEQQIKVYLAKLQESKGIASI